MINILSIDGLGSLKIDGSVLDRSSKEVIGASKTMDKNACKGFD
jgi:hypothetical protein